MAERRRFMEVVLLTAGLAASAMLAEAGLRVYAGINQPVGIRLSALDPLYSQVEPHGGIGYRQKPNSSYRYSNGTIATSNAMGFRGPMVELPKPRGVFRVVLLGGSTTHGWGVNDGETIDASMRTLMHAQYPAAAFEVVNLAFDGYDSYQLIERLRTDGLRLDPDLVIVNTGINDVRNARFADLLDPDLRTILWESALALQRDPRSLKQLSAWAQLKHVLYLARLPGLVHGMIGPRWARHEARVKITPNPAAADYFERNMRRILALVQDRATPLLFSSEPSALALRFKPDETSSRSYWLSDAAATEEYRLVLAARLRNLVVELAENRYPARYVRTQLPAEMFLDDCHLTPEGNRRLADAFVEAIEPYLLAHSERTGRP